MSFIDLAAELEGMQEEHPVSGGEYKLRIFRAKVWPDASDPKAIMVSLEITEDPFAKAVSAFINLPRSASDAKERNTYQNRLDNFLKAFEIHGLSMEDDGSVPDWVGNEGWAILDDAKDDGKGYGPQNKIKKYIAGN